MGLRAAGQIKKLHKKTLIKTQVLKINRTKKMNNSMYTQPEKRMTREQSRKIYTENQ